MAAGIADEFDTLKIAASGAAPSASNPLVDAALSLSGTALSTTNKVVDAIFATVSVADPGGANAAIPVTKSAYIGMTCAGSETNTLAIPTFIGQRMILNLDTATSGSRVVTVAAAVNQTGNNTLTFAQAADCCELIAIKVGGSFKWKIGSNDGVALSTVP